MHVLLSVDLVVDVDGVGQVLIDEVDSLPLDGVELGVQRLLLQHDVLHGSQGLSDFLSVVSLAVLSGSVLSLVSVRVVHASLLDLVLLVSGVVVDQETFLDFGGFNFESCWEDG